MRKGPSATVAHSLRWTPQSLCRTCCCFFALTCASLISSGCLINPPDELEELPQIPPRVYMESVLPTPFAYVVTSTTGPAPAFSVEFVSEDLDEDVVGHLYRNLDDINEELIGTGVVGPGSLDTVRPPMTIYWGRERETAGCYAITMTLAHRSNYEDTLISKPKDRSKTAYVTWWVAHGIAPEDLDFESCPPPAPQPSSR